LLETVSLDFTASLCFDTLEEAAFEDFVFEDLVSELFSTDFDSLESAWLELFTELSTETSEDSTITVEAGKIGAFSPAELNEPEAGAQPVGTIPMNNTSIIRIETIFFMSTLQKISVIV